MGFAVYSGSVTPQSTSSSQPCFPGTRSKRVRTADAVAAWMDSITQLSASSNNSISTQSDTVDEPPRIGRRLSREEVTNAARCVSVAVASPSCSTQDLRVLALRLRSTCAAWGLQPCDNGHRLRDAVVDACQQKFEQLLQANDGGSANTDLERSVLFVAFLFADAGLLSEAIASRAIYELVSKRGDSSKHVDLAARMLLVVAPAATPHCREKYFKTYIRVLSDSPALSPASALTLQEVARCMASTDAL